MDRELRQLLGKLLGELYRTQRLLTKQKGADAHVYALLHGFETAIEDELGRMGWVSTEQENAVGEVLDGIDTDPAALEAFRGFYDIENKLVDRGVDRGTAIRVLRKMKAESRFEAVIAKMDSTHSPIEAKRFELDDDEG